MWGRKTLPPTDPLQTALREAIQIEKDAMDYYRQAAEKMVDSKAKLTFRLLANEEREHAWSFYNICSAEDLEPFEELISAPPNTRSDWWQALQKAQLNHFDEKMALVLALEQEQQLELRLLAMAETIVDPQAREVYLANARATHRHLQVIEEDYRILLAASG